MVRVKRSASDGEGDVECKLLYDIPQSIPIPPSNAMKQFRKHNGARHLLYRLSSHHTYHCSKTSPPPPPLPYTAISSFETSATPPALHTTHPPGDIPVAYTGEEGRTLFPGSPVGSPSPETPFFTNGMCSWLRNHPISPSQTDRFVSGRFVPFVSVSRQCCCCHFM